MTPDEELRRAGEARQLMTNPLFVEACAVIENRLVAQLAQAEIAKDRAEYVRTLLVAHRKIQGYLAQVVQTGHMVDFDREMQATQENQTKSLLERIRGR